MLLPLYLGVLHAMEPDHVAVVTGVSLSGDRREAWKVGLAFGVSHMLAVALLAGGATFLGRAFLGEACFLWMDRLAWALVLLLGLWNLAAAAGLRSISLHSHEHRHGLLTHDHPHPHAHRTPRHRSRWWAESLSVNRTWPRHLRMSSKARPAQFARRRRTAAAVFPKGLRVPQQPARGATAHQFHHTAAWLGAFFGLGGVRGFNSLMSKAGISGQLQFVGALLFFGLGITAAFTLLSAISGWLATKLGFELRFRRTLYALSGLGNLVVGLYLLCKA